MDNLQLQFNNPVFHPGLNVTVRLGTKWYDAFLLSQDMMALARTKFTAPLPVDLTTAEGKKIGTGQIEETIKCYFVDIPPHILALEHDPSCQDLRGLYEGMKYPYRDKFTAGSIVTVVFFTVIETNDK